MGEAQRCASLAGGVEDRVSGENVREEVRREDALGHVGAGALGALRVDAGGVVDDRLAKGAESTKKVPGTLSVLWVQDSAESTVGAGQRGEGRTTAAASGTAAQPCRVPRRSSPSLAGAVAIAACGERQGSGFVKLLAPRRATGPGVTASRAGRWAILLLQ